MSLSTFLTALDDLHALQSEAVSITSAQEGNWRKRLVDVRRRIAEVIGRLAASIALLVPSPEMVEEYRTLRCSLSMMRTVLAEHQANWPAVTLDTSDPAFRRSLAKVVAASAALDQAASAFGQGK